ncbi:MAG TPA: cytochrome P450 [Euzebya sp.]|nr:cytochrome P450 [Euzebya sp.]
MPEPTHLDPAGLQLLAVADVATCGRPRDQLAAYRARGLHRQGGGWVVARPDDVAAALVHPALSVVPAAAGEGFAADLQRRMVRFCDQAEHAPRRAALEALLPAPAGLQAAAAHHTAAALAASRGYEAGEVLDVMPLARRVPVMVLAAALGVDAADLDTIQVLTGVLCDGLAPRLVPPAARPRVDAAASRLVRLLGAVGPWDGEQVDAAAALLFQARDATAGLIGLALLRIDRDALDSPAVVVQQTLRREPPVQCTRRTAARDLVLGGADIPAGASVWVLVAAAELGPPATPATFGAGPHGCPGATHAVALASGVLAAVLAAGWRPVADQPVQYEPRPNLRVPCRVLVRQR